jgi:RHS repeat-associated protein
MLGSSARAEDGPPVMITPGQPNVSATGAFTYTIPIAVPPGTSGMVPALSLDYSSQSGDGLEGLGWTLSGLPAIGRCPRNLAQDNVPGSVNFDTNDRFCMDGQRVVATSGEYGQDGALYRTEIEGFSKIISHGTSGNGPAWFEVHTKSGQVMEFGHTVDSLILAVGKPTARVWAVNKISDTVGNFLTIAYNNDAINGQAYPARIDYTGNIASGLAAYNSVRFGYVARSDVTPTYQAGSLLKTTVLLSSIKTYAGATLVTDYRLGYSPGTVTFRSRLTAVTQCDGSGNCQPPTTFEWQGSSGLPPMTARAVGIAQGNSSDRGWLFPGDFNADGVTDVVTRNPTSCEIFFGTQSATSPYASSAMTATYTWEREPDRTSRFVQSYDGIACFEQTPSAKFRLPDIDGDGFSDVLLDTYDSYEGSLLKNNRLGHLEEVASFLSGGVYADFNGDGRTDMLAPATADYYTLNYSNGDGTFSYAQQTVWGGASLSLYAADFDGNGCADLLQQGSTTGILYLCNPALNGYDLPDWEDSQVVLGDFNGDGKADVFVVNNNDSATKTACDSSPGTELRKSGVCLSTGVGLAATSFVVPGGEDWWKYQIVVGDWNGDGRSDIALIASGVTGGFGVNTPHKVYISTGTGFQLLTTITNSNPADTKVNAVVGDWNDDGAADIWLQKPSGDTQYLFSFAPDLIKTVRNGIGIATTVTYDRLNRAQVYTKGTNATYPARDLNGPLYVVSRVDSDNAIGGVYSSTYKYAGAQADLRGRGFLGFRTVEVTDVQTGVVQTTTYRQDFPYIGLVESQTKKRGAITLNSTSNSFNATVYSGTRRFVFLTGTVAESHDLNGAAMPTVTTSYDVYDSAGNLKQVTVSTPDGASTVTVNTYTNDTENWYLGRLKTSAVTSTVGASTITRRSSFNYDATTGLLNQEVIEPNTAALKVQTDYGRDAFGNKASVTISGLDIATRSTTTALDTKGRFATTITNALNQSETWAYNDTFGLPTSHIGPNGQQTTWAYDGYGRKTLEVRSDGTRTNVEYLYCSGVAGGTTSCPVRGAFLVKMTPFGADGSTQIGPTATLYFDALSRTIATDTQGFDGKIIRVDTQYDANGRVAQASRPYFIVGGTPKWTVFTYDNLGRVTKVIMPDGSETTSTYNGLTTSVTNDKGQTTTTIKNAQGLTEKVTDTFNKPIVYAYDASGNLTTITEAAKITSHTYDVRGRKIQSSDPDMGTWTYGYNVLGELITQTDAKNQTTTLAYDQLGRLTQRVEPEVTSSWTYDTAAVGIGKLAQASTSFGYLREHFYDSKGRPRRTRLTISGQVSNYLIEYDPISGKLDTINYPSSLVLKHVYNPYGYLSQLTDNLTGSVFWTANARDSEMHLLKQTAGNGIVTNQTFDSETGLVQTIKAGPQASVANYSYDFDTLGNLINRSDAVTGLSETFDYDQRNRLTQAAIVGGAVQAVTYGYQGNISSKTGVGTYNYGAGSAGPHAVTSVTGTVNGVVNPVFAYDANGNMISGAGRTIVYASFNMASQITQGSVSIGFGYDAEHKRVVMTGPQGQTRYLNDPATGSTSERFLPTSGANEWRDYLMAEGRLVALRTQQGTTASLKYFVADHLGSVSVITDETGAVLQRLSYDAWGQRRNPDGTYPATPISSLTTRGFTGQEELDELSLINFNARIYDPVLGRFMSADPMVEDIYLLQVLNHYSYVGNNPLSFTDPSGLCFLGCFWQQSWFRPVVAIAAALTLNYYLPMILPEFGFLPIAGAQINITGVVAAGVSGGVAGFINTGTLKGMLIGAFQAGSLYGAGSWVQGLSNATEHAAASFISHGLIGGLATELGGGEFSSGFLAAGFGSLASPLTATMDDLSGTVAASLIGGATAVLGGGKFKNGAITGAFGYVYNALAHRPHGVHVSVRGRSIQGHVNFACRDASAAQCKDSVERMNDINGSYPRGYTLNVEARLISPVLRLFDIFGDYIRISFADLGDVNGFYCDELSKDCNEAFIVKFDFNMAPTTPAHEFGHIIGFVHTDMPGFLMSSPYAGPVPTRPSFQEFMKLYRRYGGH